MTIEFWDFWSHYGISKKATIIQFRVITDYHIICCRQKYKTFDDLIKIAIAHEKKNYICEISPSCSFSGRKFVIKSSLDKTKRYQSFLVYHIKPEEKLKFDTLLPIYRKLEKYVSINPHYLNYGDSQPEDSIWNKSGITILIYSSILEIFLHNYNNFFRKYNCLCVFSNHIGFDRNHLGSWLWYFNKTKIWLCKK